MFIKKSTTPTVAARMTRKPGKERMLFSSKLDDVYEGGRLPRGSVLVGIGWMDHCCLLGSCPFQNELDR
nr:unnamed protein product [Callosobruchus chinensis]